MPFGSTATNQVSFMPFHSQICYDPKMNFDPFPPPVPTVTFVPTNMHIYAYGIFNKENLSTLFWLKELQMTRSEIYQALMIHVLRTADKERYGFPMEDVNVPGKAVIASRGDETESDDDEQKVCSRCKNSFNYSSINADDKCVYHWGKLRRAPFDQKGQMYTCCGKSKGSIGCKHASFHVSSGIDSMSGTDFVKTRASRKKCQYDVFALDCEMCYTSKGLELTKVSLVALDGTIVYDSFVKPVNLILDYNTQFSGVTFEDLAYCNKTLCDVQRDLLNIIDSRTILIGHGLENDLKALRLIHSLVIDTSVVFPHQLGFPYRQSLKHLVSSVLHKNIQRNERTGLGHNSVEDAKSCLELMFWKLRKEKSESKRNLFTYDPFDSS